MGGQFLSGEQLQSVVFPMVLAFAVSAAAGPFLIPFLRKVKAGQTERDDGPKSHLGKTGTPNMGGLMILLGLLVAGGLFSVRYKEVLPVLFLTVGFGAVGFIDDYIKVVLKRSMGLRVWQKMALQIAITCLFAWYITQGHSVPLSMKVPFAAGVTIDFGILNVPVLIFIVVATVNGTNFTDGVDGLSSSVTVAVALFFTIAALMTGAGVAPAGAAMIGALLGFLLYNAYPAKIFMGDTGSLALGGFVAGMAYMMELPLLIPMVGFIYMIEVVSVILQVGYFKATHGKRLFKMAPIHHHFEICGWSEVQVVAVFTIVTVMLCAVALLGVW